MIDPDFPPVTLLATAFTKDQLIRSHSPQIALAGRSNVGKSSLVNALAGRKNLAKTSATPGKTRSVNYYLVGETDRLLVDLPGYGYARCGQEERKKWADLLELYFRATPGLRSLLLLLDSRLRPQPLDTELVSFAASLGLPVTAILTKADKSGKRDISACIRAWSAILDQDSFIVTSAATKLGIEELRNKIMAALI